ncbi:MAG: peptide deformylase [Gammaproteobacteria bacterium]|jgi:peptide deformylase
MTLRKILHYPNPKLRNIAESVDKVDADIKRLVDDMFETMYEDNGIGLAATQIGIDLRIFVVDIQDNKQKPRAFINPVIIEKTDEQQCPEGCLSVPGVYAKVKRANIIAVEALDRDGKKFTLQADGLLSAAIQHELDHLDGKLFIDRLSSVKKQLIKSKLKKLQKANL